MEKAVKEQTRERQRGGERGKIEYERVVRNKIFIHIQMEEEYNNIQKVETNEIKFEGTPETRYDENKAEEEKTNQPVSFTTLHIYWPLYKYLSILRTIHVRISFAIVIRCA